MWCDACDAREAQVDAPDAGGGSARPARLCRVCAALRALPLRRGAGPFAQYARLAELAARIPELEARGQWVALRYVAGQALRYQRAAPDGVLPPHVPELLARFRRGA